MFSFFEIGFFSFFHHQRSTAEKGGATDFVFIRFFPSIQSTEARTSFVSDLFIYLSRFTEFRPAFSGGTECDSAIFPS